MHDLKLTPTESGTKTGTNTSRGVWCGDIFEKCDFVKVSNSNYLQAERSSRWSGWRDSPTHSTLDSQTDIYSYNIKELNF